MFEYKKASDNPPPSVSAQTQQNLIIAEHDSAHNAGDMSSDAHVDVHDKKSRKYKMYHHNFASFVPVCVTLHPQREITLL